MGETTTNETNAQATYINDMREITTHEQTHIVKDMITNGKAQKDKGDMTTHATNAQAKSKNNHERNENKRASNDCERDENKRTRGKHT